MNSAMWDPVLNFFFAEFRICGSCEQCTGPTIFLQNAKKHVQRAFQMHTKIYQYAKNLYSFSTYNIT